MIKLLVLASGSGSNAERLFQYFENDENIRVKAIGSNRADAGVWKRFEGIEIDRYVFTKSDISHTEYLDQWKQYDAIILAGFLWLIPNELLTQFPDRMINVHPSLLPKYGGKGMYGMHVHQAVIANKETQSGITIHLVNAQYDEGKILSQHTCNIAKDDTPELLAAKIHELEYQYFPLAVKSYLSSYFYSER